jgi:hypothetical protein
VTRTTGDPGTGGRRLSHLTRPVADTTCTATPSGTMTVNFPVEVRRTRSISRASQLAVVRSSRTLPVDEVTVVSAANCHPAGGSSRLMPVSSLSGWDSLREAGG